jgi:hypothetical protein
MPDTLRAWRGGGQRSDGVLIDLVPDKVFGKDAKGERSMMKKFYLPAILCSGNAKLRTKHNMQ